MAGRHKFTTKQLLEAHPELVAILACLPPFANEHGVTVDMIRSTIAEDGYELSNEDIRRRLRFANRHEIPISSVYQAGKRGAFSWEPTPHLRIVVEQMYSLD